IPPTSGFIAKLGVFGAAAAAHSYALLLVGVVTSVITAFFYLRVILTMYAAEDEQAEPDELEVEPAHEPLGFRPQPCSPSACWPWPSRRSRAHIRSGTSPSTRPQHCASRPTRSPTSTSSTWRRSPRSRPARTSIATTTVAGVGPNGTGGPGRSAVGWPATI